MPHDNWLLSAVELWGSKKRMHSGSSRKRKQLACREITVARATSQSVSGPRLPVSMVALLSLPFSPSISHSIPNYNPYQSSFPSLSDSGNLSHPLPLLTATISWKPQNPRRISRFPSPSAIFQEILSQMFVAFNAAVGLHWEFHFLENLMPRWNFFGWFPHRRWSFVWSLIVFEFDPIGRIWFWGNRSYV